MTTTKKSTYSLRVLEMVSREIGEAYKGYQIERILIDFGIPKEEIKTPSSKWWVVNEALKYLKNNKEDPETEISKLIMEFLHPLNLNLDDNKESLLANKIEKIIAYDKFDLIYTGDEYIIFSEEEQAEMHMDSHISIEKEEEDDSNKIKKSKDLLKKILDNHQTFMDLLEVFCSDIKHPTNNLNNSYLFLVKTISEDIKKLGTKINKINFYKPFSGDLYSAESEWTPSPNVVYWEPMQKLSWESIRPKLYNTHSQIIKLYNIANVDAETDDESKRLEEIKMLIDEKRTAKSSTSQKPIFGTPTSKIIHEHKHTFENSIQEKELNVNHKTLEENTITKGKKKISLPIFPETDWSKVDIRFFDEQNVFITAGKKNVPADYASLGFEDETKKQPDIAWKFLVQLAKNGGESNEIESPIPDKIKQYKKKISDKLKTIFKNDTDPFYDFTKSNTYKIKIKLSFQEN